MRNARAVYVKKEKTEGMSSRYKKEKRQQKTTKDKN